MVLSLKINNGFKWFNTENIYAKGYVFYQEKLYVDISISELLLNTKSIEDFSQKISNFNGQFAIIANLEHEIIAAVDNSRSIPLFYNIIDNEICIADNIDEARIGLNPMFNETSIFEYLQTGYVVGNRTLLKDFYQIAAGEYLYFSKVKKEPITHKYYVHKSTKINYCNREEHFINLEKITNNVFLRLVESLNGRCAVIPLSGGYDSRYIVSMLKRLNYENVICYTYGRPDSFEVQISKNVAKKLNYEWHYIEYNELSFKELFKAKEFIDYFKYASNYSSLAHYQDLLAVKTLKEKLIIPFDSIFIPGFCGDLLGGSYLPQEVIYKKPISNLNINNYIFDKHFNLNSRIKSKHSKEIKTNLTTTLASYNYNKTYESLVETNDGWFTEHKASKFVVNAVKIFEFYNHEWRLPLWDYELINYWYNVPYHYKLPKNKLYNDFLFAYLFNTYEINFTKEFHSGIRNKVVENIKAIFPVTFFSWYRKIIKYGSLQKSENSFNILFNYWSKELKNDHFDHINQIASYWQLYKIHNYKSIDRL